MKIGRNDPCPCGSGKKYKHCCISVSRALSDELSDLLSGQEFGSLEELQAVTDSLMAKQNQKPQADFLRAFPMVIDEIEGSSYSTPEEDLRRCYCYRAIKRFLVFLGLAELEVIKGEKPYEHKYKIKKTPLFDTAIHFNLIELKISKAILSSIHSDHLH